VTSVWDEERRSNVIRCQGSAEAGGFIIGDRYDVNPNDEDWNETRRVVSFWYKNGFDKIVFYVSISGGYQYRVQYRASHGTSGYNGSGWVTIYLGPEVCSSAWRRFERNIAEDWETYAPPELSWWNTDGMIVWPKGGDYSYLTFIDDIRFSNSKTVQFNALTGGSIGQIAAEYTLGDFPSQTVKWLHYDRLGNVMNKSGSAGTSTDTYYQDAYGNVISNIATGQWASSMSGRHLTTKEYDGDANLYYFWQRWYDPQTGRFISQAPFPPYMEHPYGYAQNNPISKGDSLGTFPRRLPYPFDLLQCIASVIRSYREHKGGRTDDKYRHCLVGCEIVGSCGLWNCLQLGIAKEIIDILGPGDSDIMDAIATHLGCGAPDNVPGDCCEDKCEKLFKP